MKVKDLNGSIINGLVRTNGGGLSVDNSIEYQMYLNAKKQKETFDNLVTQVNNQEQKINTIMSDINEIKTLILSLSQNSGIIS